MPSAAHVGPSRYSKYRMMNTSSELLRIVDAAEASLRGVSEEESEAPILPGGWSRKELLGHLIDSASNNHQRFVRAALADSLDFPAYEQDGWADLQDAEKAPWEILVVLWA